MKRSPLARTTRFGLALAVLCACPVLLHAQKPISVGIGGGTGFGSRNSAEGTFSHALAFAELHLPLIPLGVRGDAMFMTSSKSGALSLGANAVYRLPIPIVTPYATAGYGLYGVGSSSRTGGWAVGAGLRVGVPGGPGLFGEVRRHERLRRDVVTLGLAF
jgi:hypothetical protein